jgi:S-adenosylmethionine:tRNA ribosyltransferase-isomerase
MLTSLFDYPLPNHLIAQTPLAERDASRLLIADAHTKSIADSQFSHLPNILNSAFCAHNKPPLIIVNRSRVFPARIRVQRKSGGRGEVFLLEKGDSNASVSCLIRPQKKLREGEILYADTKDTEKARPLLRIESLNPPRVSPVDSTFSELIAAFGEMPLPPYIERDPQKVGSEYAKLDKMRYQTLYAHEEGSVAAATAGLHFTDTIIEKCRSLGCEFAHVVLHVGLGTFQPVQATRVAEHKMHQEYCMVPEKTAEKIAQWITNEWPIIFVGTTSLRTVESFARRAFAKSAVPVSQLRQHIHDSAQNGSLQKIFMAEAGLWFSTELFLHPDNLESSKTPSLGDAILTNFHQPQSTLAMLVASILSYPFWQQVYAHAIEKEYRFLSYGDSSLLYFAERVRP